MMIGAYFLVLVLHALQVVWTIDNSVVIVGGGIAGLAAADKLKSLQFTRITVVEASERLGGRIKSVQDSTGVGYLDLGAEYIYGRVFNPVYERANSLNALATLAQTNIKNAKDFQYLTLNGCQLNSAIVRNLTQYQETLDTQVMAQAGQAGQTLSAGTLYDNANANFLAQNPNIPSALLPYYGAAFNLTRKRVEEDMACTDWHLVSAQSFKAFDEPPEDAVIYMGINGFRPILDDFVNRIGLANIRLRTEVTNINYNNPSQVTLTLAGGGTLSADHVIVTPSLGFLKANAAALFTPALPASYTTAMNGMTFGTVDKVFLVYSTPFWTPNTGTQYFMRVTGDPWNCVITPLTPNNAETNLATMFWYFETHPTHPNVLVGTVTGLDVDRLEAVTSTQLRLNMAATEVLRRFNNNFTIPFASKVIWSKWKTDRLFLGSRSYFPAPCSSSCTAAALAAPITVTRNGRQAPAVLIAGEATWDDLQGTLQGAWLSGERAAQQISDFYVPPPSN